MYQLIDPIIGNGQDGIATLSGTDSAIDSACTGTAGSKTLVATNASFAVGQIVLIHQTQGAGAGQWELNKIASYSAGNMGLEHNLANNYVSGAQVYVVRQYQQVTISASYTTKAWNGTVGGILAFLVRGKLTVSGSLVGTARGFRGATLITGGAARGKQGEGINGGLDGVSTAKNANAGGGGDGVDFFGGGSGGGGGNKTAGADGGFGGTSGDGGQGGDAVGTDDLTIATLPGAGGSGGTYNTSESSGKGGIGASFFYIMAQYLEVTGTIPNNGEAGGNATGSGGDKGGGGGAAGGDNLLRSYYPTLGSSLVTATAGTGGTGAGSASAGGNGSVGRNRVEAPVASVTTNPAASLLNDVSWAGVCP